LAQSLVFACAGSLLACSGGGDNCYIGDRMAAAELVPVHRTPDGRMVDIVEGGAVTLEQPPQGGRVLFVGVRAKNVSCALPTLQATLRDEASGRIAGLEERPVVLKPAASGFGEPDQPAELSNYSNLAACPNGNFRLQQDLFARSYRLELRIVDRFGKTAEVSRRVVPDCAPEGFAQCRCECGACYVLGDACGADAGAGPVDGGVCVRGDGGS
jgi:hypothetical protein